MKYLLLALTLFSLINCGKRPALKTGLEGKPMPTFSLLMIDSSTQFSTANIPEGKPVALFYFSPHCPYCRAETAEITESMDKLKGVHIYMITNYPYSEMKQFYQEYKLSKYPNITIGYDPQYAFLNYFKAAGIPYWALYGKDKKLSGVYMGLIKSKELATLIN